MKKIAILLAVVSLASLSQAALKPGDSLSPYIIQNTATGKEYCQVCQYGAKTAKIIEFGKLQDEAFWKDLQKLQKLQNQNPQQLGVFAQVFDSSDAKAIHAAAVKHGIKFPVVVAVAKNWNELYDINGVSRTIYYAQRNHIAWTSTGLDESTTAQLQTQVKKDLAS